MGLAGAYAMGHKVCTTDRHMITLAGAYAMGHLVAGHHLLRLCPLPTLASTDSPIRVKRLTCLLNLSTNNSEGVELPLTHSCMGVPIGGPTACVAVAVF